MAFPAEEAPSGTRYRVLAYAHSWDEDCVQELRKVPGVREIFLVEPLPARLLADTHRFFMRSSLPFQRFDA